MKGLSVVAAGFKPAATDKMLTINPDFCPVFFYIFSDGTDFAYIEEDILCLFDCSFF